MRRLLLTVCAALVLCSSSVIADGGDEAVAVSQFRPRPISDPAPRFALGIKAGTLGIGIQGGTSLGSRVNLRGGGNFFPYRDTLNQDGIDYNGTLHLQSIEAKLDVFVAGGFRVTPGLLLYNNNNVSATATVPPGRSITLGGVSYTSSPSDPLRGNAAITFKKFAPSLGIGFGNLLPRSARRWSLSTDLGVVFSGSPEFALGLTGSACANGTICQPVTTPSVSTNVEAQRAKIQNDLRDFKYYPEVSIMFGRKF